MCCLSLTNWSEISDIVTAGAALIALAGAYWQIRESRSCQREATASELYRNYLTLAVEYPRLARGDMAIPKKDAPQSEKDEFERYEWFVSVMLHAVEQILDLTKGDEAWQKAIADQIQYHQNYLSSPGFVREHFSDDLKAFFPKPSQPA